MKMEVRFRPLAGFWFLKTDQQAERLCWNSFPSPCGVLVLKGIRTSRGRGADISFRPLAGFWFLKLIRSGYHGNEEEQFPSPCGVLVLKASLRRFSVRRSHSFRPLAGFWFLKGMEEVDAFLREEVGFRPLAGFWFLN